MFDGVAEAAGDLRRAAHGVGVLNLVLLEFFERRGEDLRALCDPQDVCCRGRLARMRAQLLEVFGKDDERAQQALDRHRRRDVCGLGELAQIGNGQAQHAQHAVRAVDER